MEKEKLIKALDDFYKIKDDQNITYEDYEESCDTLLKIFNDYIHKNKINEENIFGTKYFLHDLFQQSNRLRNNLNMASRFDPEHSNYHLCKYWTNVKILEYKIQLIKNNINKI